VPNHRVAVSIGTDTHDDLHCIREIAGIARYLEEKGLSEKLLQPQVREEVAEGVAVAESAASR
jgi:hypothetical protein